MAYKRLQMLRGSRKTCIRALPRIKLMTNQLSVVMVTDRVRTYRYSIISLSSRIMDKRFCQGRNHCRLQPSSTIGSAGGVNSVSRFIKVKPVNTLYHVNSSKLELLVTELTSWTVFTETRVKTRHLTKFVPNGIYSNVNY